MPAAASAPAVNLESALAHNLVEQSYLSSQAAVSPYRSELASKGSGVSLQLQDALRRQAAQLTKSAAAPEQATSAALPETLPAMQGQPMAAFYLNAQSALSSFAAAPAAYGAYAPGPMPQPLLELLSKDVLVEVYAAGYEAGYEAALNALAMQQGLAAGPASIAPSPQPSELPYGLRLAVQTPAAAPSPTSNTHKAVTGPQAYGQYGAFQRHAPGSYGSAVPQHAGQAAHATGSTPLYRSEAVQPQSPVAYRSRGTHAYKAYAYQRSTAPLLHAIAQEQAAQYLTNARQAGAYAPAPASGQSCALLVKFEALPC